MLGWISGIFSGLRRKPRFRLGLIEGPTFACTFKTGEKYGEFEVHRTGFALYVHISNTGTAPSSIHNVAVGYHWCIKPLSIQWFKYGVGWFWLENQVTSLSDFQYRIGENIKFFPFLTQASSMSLAAIDTYLQIGKSANGVVYFEQSESFGGCFPLVVGGKVSVKVRITHVFGRHYTRVFQIPAVSLEDARKYNPAFGSTMEELKRHHEAAADKANPAQTVPSSPKK